MVPRSSGSAANSCNSNHRHGTQMALSCAKSLRKKCYINGYSRVGPFHIRRQHDINSGFSKSYYLVLRVLLKTGKSMYVGFQTISAHFLLRSASLPRVSHYCFTASKFGSTGHIRESRDTSVRAAVRTTCSRSHSGPTEVLCDVPPVTARRGPVRPGPGHHPPGSTICRLSRRDNRA